MQEYANDESNGDIEKKLRVVVSHFKDELKDCKYYASYFARSAKCDRFCDKAGWFLCEGSYGEDSCMRRHSINPYATRDARILFSTWNLDHQ